MVIGKWNRSVIITYLGVIFSLIGMVFAVSQSMNYAICCLIIAGICDLFDGVYARSIKRTNQEKAFGKELDSLADVVNFIAFPIVISIGMEFTQMYNMLIYAYFAICGIARLAYFNISSEEVLTGYYRGLPVTFTALILSLIYGLNFLLNERIFEVIFVLSLAIIGTLNILNIKVKKPRGIAYIFFSLMAIILLVLYMVIL